jgi:formylglycine-generating enzyme required for sulfatase activity
MGLLVIFSIRSFLDTPEPPKIKWLLRHMKNQEVTGGKVQTPKTTNAWGKVFLFVTALVSVMLSGRGTWALEVRFVNPLGMEFILIRPGEFLMGSRPGGPYLSKDIYRDSDEVQHPVRITRPFYMQITEVTQSQWKRVMGSNPSHSKDCGEDCPVERVSWLNVKAFIKRLNKMGIGSYRLPTEAEWEYSARAGTDTPFSWGEKVDCTKAMFQNNTLRGWDHCVPHYRKMGLPINSPAPVKSFPPNPWGIFDMHGNVWEWCEDWYGPYPNGLVADPKGPKRGREKVRRGGSWFGKGTLCRSANRNRSHPASRYRTTGFRLVMEPPRQSTSKPASQSQAKYPDEVSHIGGEAPDFPILKGKRHLTSRQNISTSGRDSIGQTILSFQGRN